MINALARSNNRLANIFRDDPFDWFDWTLPTFPSTVSAMKVDVVKGDKETVIKADLPGLTKDDVKITAENGLLTIRGEKSAEKDSKTDDYVIRERSYGAISRSFELPQGLDTKNIKASFKDGVLSVTVPNLTPAKPKLTEIQID